MSDHISGPRALADPIADITDVYAFPSPERPDRLVLVMNTLPMAKPSDLFSDGLLYRFRLRPLTRPTGDGQGGGSSRPTRSTSSTASSPRRSTRRRTGPVQEGTCTSPTGESVSFRVNDPQGGAGAGIRVFAGIRWDPFIMDARAALATIATRKLAFTDPGSIFLDGKNVLSIVVEIDTRLLGGAGPRGCRRRDADPRRVQRPDRTGRPARGEEHDARAEGVRPGEPGPGDPRPLQHGGRVPPRRLLRRCLPRAAGRQPRLLGRPGRQGGLAHRTRTATTR